MLETHSLRHSSGVRIVNFNALFKHILQPDKVHSVTEGEFSAVIERYRVMSTVAIMCGCYENIYSSDYPPILLGGKRWKSSNVHPSRLSAG
jgi:hypothetical protein